MTSYYLATVIPTVRRLRLPLVRDQVMLLMIAVNEIFLGLDTYLAHSTSGTIVPREWIPILFGPVAGALLMVAGLVAFRRRMVANVLATLVFLSSIAVGLLGSYYHWVRAILPYAAASERVALPLLVWAPPILGPITFALVGILGLSAAWQEEPEGSGILILPGNKRLHMPFDKSRAYFFLIGLGALITVISSVLDHARSNFVNPWVWLPTVIGIFAAGVIFSLAVIEQPTRADLAIYTATMLALIVVGLVGAWLHIDHNLVSQGTLVQERFLRGAPLMAPLLFTNIGGLGIIVLLSPVRDEPPTAP